MPDKEFCFFLIPVAPLKAQLTPIIEKLAADYDAVTFVPHVTAYVGPSNDNEARTIASRIVREFAPVQLTYEKIGYTDLFYKTLFVQFGESSAQRKISEAIRAGCANPSAYALNPHLSLMYKRMPPGEQAKLSQTLTVPKGTYTLDGFRVVEADAVEDGETVRRWRTVYDGMLGA